MTLGHKAEYVFLPHISNIERLALAGEMIDQDRAFDNKMIANPTNWYSQIADNVVVVSSGGDGIKFGRAGAPPDASPDAHTTEDIYSLEVKTSTPSSEGDGYDDTNPAHSSMDDGDPIHAPGVGWLLCTYVAKAKETNHSNFINLLGNCSSININKIKDKDFSSIIQDILSNTVNRRMLADCYREAFGRENEFNRTSLCLHSGPAFIGRWRCCSPFDRGDNWRFHHECECPIDNKISYLTTGDAVLGEQSDIDAFVKHYGELLINTRTLSLPHHGSVKNFHPDLIKKTNPVNVFATCKETSAHHPSPDVVARLQGVGLTLQKITDEGRGFYQSFHLSG